MLPLPMVQSVIAELPATSVSNGALEKLPNSKLPLLIRLTAAEAGEAALRNAKAAAKPNKRVFMSNPPVENLKNQSAAIAADFFLLWR
jgi:hypothetical protein